MGVRASSPFDLAMRRAKEVIERIRQETDEIILFHSLSGKDSIALLDMVYPVFKRVVCVFMYAVPNLEHIQQYYIYAKKKYPNIEFVQVPHYGVFSYRKYGYMGLKGNSKQRLFKLSDIIDKIRERYNIEWVCLGFKQSDSLNRQLMLRTYKDGLEAICWSGKKFYPLSTYKNADVLRYIERHKLKTPENYGGGEQSSGTCITDVHYLKYLQKNYPQDLIKITNTYPAVINIIATYEREQNNNNQEESDNPESV